MRRRALAIQTIPCLGAMLLPGAVRAQSQPANPDVSPHPMPPTEPGTSPSVPVRPSPEATGSAAPRPPTAQTAPGPEGQRASTLIGANVYNDGDDNIGRVRDLLLARNGEVTAVLAVGGFLGIGSKDVAVSFQDLRWNAERERWILPGATAESLRARPAFNLRDGR